MRDVSRIWGLDPQFLGQRSAKPGLLRSDSQCGISDSGIGVYVRVRGKGMEIAHFCQIYFHKNNCSLVLNGGFKK